MIQRRITEQEIKKMLLYHELSHYLLCEISRKIEPTLSKATKILAVAKVASKDYESYVAGACITNTVTEKNKTINQGEIDKLEKIFFLEDKKRLFLKTLQLTCGYLSSTIFVFDDNLDYYINQDNENKDIFFDENKLINIKFYSIKNELEKMKMNRDFESIKKYWKITFDIEINETEWEIFIKYTKNVLEFNEIKNLVKNSFDFCLNLQTEPNFVIVNDNLLALENHVQSLLSNNIIEFYKANLADFVEDIKRLYIDKIIEIENVNS